MKTSIVNAKIDSYTKERVDQVLSQHGKTTSDAIKSLWQYLSIAPDIPDFMKENESLHSQERKEAISDLLALAGSVSVPAAEANLDYRDLLASVMNERNG